MQRQIELIGAAWGLGGADPGCAEAPAVLVPLLAQRLAACGAAAISGPILEPAPGERRRQSPSAACAASSPRPLPMRGAAAGCRA